MNGLIFQIFGAAILIFELFLVAIFILALPSATRVADGLLFFFGFLIVSTIIALGLIRLQRWAAMTASILGLIWSLALASSLGHGHGEALLFGTPVVFGMLLPLYATIRYWSSLKAVDEPKLMPFVRALRSLDRFHLE